MIGYVHGKVLFSDGRESVILTMSGVGYQIFINQVLTEDSHVALYISHVIKESSEEMYGFKTLREKKMFELLMSVKGVGPKSAFSLLSTVGIDRIIDAITHESKRSFLKAPGVGPKAAAQIVLDLSGKVQKIRMYSEKIYSHKVRSVEHEIETNGVLEFEQPESSSTHSSVVNEALLACKELGFKDSVVEPLIYKFLNSTTITKPEQLVHLVLKEL